MNYYTYDDNLVSDLHKTAYHVRPSESWWAEWNSASAASKQAAWNALLEEASRELTREREQNLRALCQFEKRLSSIRAETECNREQAVCRLLESLPFTRSMAGHSISIIAEAACYELGLDPSDIAYIKSALKLYPSFLTGTATPDQPWRALAGAGL